MSGRPLGTTRAQIADLHRDHPDWCTAQIADGLGRSRARVSALAKQLGIDLPRKGRSRAKYGAGKRWQAISVLFERTLYGEVRARAYGQNMSVSEYIRRLVQADIQQRNGG